METKLLYQDSEYKENALSNGPVSPLLFISIDREIFEYHLSGRQTVGRPSVESIPDIIIPNHYVSRKHGFFETDGICKLHSRKDHEPNRISGKGTFSGRDAAPF